MSFKMREPLPPGGQLIRTTSFQLVQELGLVVFKSHGMLVVEGISGAGKTVSVEYLLAKLPAECVTLHLANRARGNEVATGLAELLGARNLAPGGRAARKALKTLLEGRNVVIFVDEADRLNADACDACASSGISRGGPGASSWSVATSTRPLPSSPKSPTDSHATPRSTRSLGRPSPRRSRRFIPSSPRPRWMSSRRSTSRPATASS